jgi:hypothetical protein
MLVREGALIIHMIHRYQDLLEGKGQRGRMS